MSPLLRFATSTLGKKYLMALSGLALVLFVIAHMVGNLQIFLGREFINAYGHFLQSKPELIWPARLGLLAMVCVHIAAGISLAIENMQARAAAYEVKRVVGATLASRTMMVTGLIVVSFIVYHLLHFTVMNLHPEYRGWQDELGNHDVYRMMVVGFSNGWVAGFYTLSIGLLCFHLSHGVGAMFQSLGLKNEAYAARIDWVARIVAVVLFIGYVSIPVAIQIGLVK